MKRSLFGERVNTYLGIAFLASFALWAMMIIWNFTSGTNPIDTAIAASIDQMVSAQ